MTAIPAIDDSYPIRAALRSYTTYGARLFEYCRLDMLAIVRLHP